ncbi:MAG: hypothetical protein WD877_00485 [Candidatus Saccharimonadales bacterium]
MVRKLRKLYLNKRLALVVTAALLLLVGAFAFNQSKDKDVATETAPEPYINLDPPTAEQKQATEEFKKSLAEDQPRTPRTTSSGKTQVTPIITSVSGGEVRSYVQGVIEDGGTCTAIATKSGASLVSSSSIGFADATYTGCPPIKLDLSGNGWSVTVSYSSPTSEGKSSAYGAN